MPDFLGAQRGGDAHIQRIALELPADLAHGIVVGGREQQGLALARDLRGDGMDVLAEAHVEHAVGLIEYQHAYRRQRQRTFLQQFQDATGRANHQVRLMRQ